MADTTDKLLYTITVEDQASVPMKKIVGELGKGQKSLESFAKAFERLGSVNLQQLAPSLLLMDAAIGKLSKSLQPISQMMTDFSKATAGMYDGVVKSSVKIASVVKSLQDLGKVDLSGLSNTLKSLEPFFQRIEQAAPSLQVMATSMNKLAKEAALAGAENEKLKAKIETLNLQTEAAKLKNDALREKLNAAKDALAAKAKAAADAAQANQKLIVTYDAFTGAVVKTWDALKNFASGQLTKSLDGFGKSVNDTADKFQKWWAEMASGEVIAKKTFDGLSMALTGVADVAAKAFGMILDGLKRAGEMTVEFVADSVKAYANFEEALNPAARTMGLTKDETAALGKELQKLAGDFTETGLKGGIASDELARIAGIAGQMGISFKDNKEGMLAFTETVAKTSVAFEMSAEKTAESLSMISNVFNIPIEKAAELGGAFAMLGNQTEATVPQLLDFTKRLGTGFAQIGGTAEQAAAIGATLRSAGLQVEVAGTAMTGIFTRMQTDYTKFEEVLAAGGLQKGALEMALRSQDALGALQLVTQAVNNLATTKGPVDATKALDELGISGRGILTVMQTLSAKIPELNANLASIKDPVANAAALNDMYVTSQQNLNAQLDAAKNLWSVITQVIGKELNEAFTYLLEKVNPFLAFLGQWLQESPVAQALFQAMGDVVEFLADELGKAFASIQLWLGGAKEASAANVKMIIEIQEARDAFKQWIADSFVWLKDNAPTIWQGIKDGLMAVKDAVVAAFGWWKRNGDEVVTVMGKIYDGLASLVNYAKDAPSIWQAFWDEMAKPFIWLDEKITKLSGGTLPEMSSGITKWLLNPMGELAKIVAQVGTTAKSVFDGMTGAIKGVYDAVAGLVGKMGEVVVGLAKIALKGWEQSTFPDMVMWSNKSAEAVKGITEQSGNLVKALQTAEQAGWKVMKSMTAATTPEQLNYARQIVGSNFAPAGGGLAQATLMASQGYYADKRPISTAPTAQAAPSTTPPLQPQVGAGMTGGDARYVTINVEGNLINDERSMQQFGNMLGRSNFYNQRIASNTPGYGQLFKG